VAEKADVAIFFLGLPGSSESEGFLTERPIQHTALIRAVRGVA